MRKELELLLQFSLFKGSEKRKDRLDGFWKGKIEPKRDLLSTV